MRCLPTYVLFRLPTFVICKPLWFVNILYLTIVKTKPLPTSIHSQLAKKNKNHPQRNVSLWEILGKGCNRVSPSSVHFPWTCNTFVTLRTPCSQPAWCLFCYRSEVNRFYSSYKPVTKATVLISIINIHNSSSPAWEASWAILYKRWILRIFMSCLQRSLVL